MKTPINQLIAFIEIQISALNYGSGEIHNINEVLELEKTLNKAKLLLNEEKEIIKQIYSDGLGNGEAYESRINPIGSKILDEEHYYNKKFENENTN